MKDARFAKLVLAVNALVPLAMLVTDYFRDRLGTGFLATLSPALSDQEIVVMAAGLVMAGGDATASHLSSCVHHLLHDDELRRTLTARPDLIPAAVDAVRQWRYQPTLLNEKPVEVITLIQAIFKLNQ